MRIMLLQLAGFYHTHLCMYVRVRAYMWYAGAYVCMHTYMHVRMHARTSAYLLVCEHASRYVRMNVCR